MVEPFVHAVSAGGGVEQGYGFLNRGRGWRGGMRPEARFLGCCSPAGERSGAGCAWRCRGRRAHVLAACPPTNPACFVPHTAVTQATSARQGAELLGALVSEHGAGEAFGVLIADRQEAWWVAQAPGVAPAHVRTPPSLQRRSQPLASSVCHPPSSPLPSCLPPHSRYLETGSGHHWLAQRVPDRAFFVSANQGRFQV